MTISATIDLESLESSEGRISIEYRRPTDGFRATYSVPLETRYHNLIRRQIKFDHGTVARFLSRQSPASAEMTYVEDLYCEALSRSTDKLGPETYVHDLLGKPRVSLSRNSFDGQRFIANYLPFIVQPSKAKEECFTSDATLSIILNGRFLVLACAVNPQTRLTVSCDPAIYVPEIYHATEASELEQSLYVEYCKSGPSEAMKTLQQVETQDADFMINVCSMIRLNASNSYTESNLDLPRPNLYLKATIKLMETYLGFDHLFHKTLLDISRT